MAYKTNKTLSKRFKVTKTGKLIKRTCGQDHFNARDNGKKIRNKRRDRKMSEAYAGTIKKLI